MPDCVLQKSFFVIEDETNNIGTSFSSPIAIEGKKFEIREGISLDDIMLELNEIKKISFIKIDVEGQELDVLQSGEKLILSNRPFICLEIFPENYQQVDNYLKKMRYRQIDNYYHNYIYGYKFSTKYICVKIKSIFHTLKKKANKFNKKVYNQISKFFLK